MCEYEFMLIFSKIKKNENKIKNCYKSLKYPSTQLYSLVGDPLVPVVRGNRHYEPLE